MSGIGDAIQAQRRLAILQLLDTQPGKASNDRVLASALGMVGVVIPRAALRDELDWLVERRLVRTEVAAPFVLVTLRERGADVAAGRSGEPGVAEPGAEF